MRNNPRLERNEMFAFFFFLICIAFTIVLVIPETCGDRQARHQKWVLAEYHILVSEAHSEICRELNISDFTSKKCDAIFKKI